MAAQVMMTVPAPLACKRPSPAQQPPSSGDAAHRQSSHMTKKVTAHVMIRWAQSLALRSLRLLIVVCRSGMEAGRQEPASQSVRPASQQQAAT